MSDAMKFISEFCIVILMLIALAVAIILYTEQRACWTLITTYWFVLTAKNAFDYLSTQRRNKENES